MKKIREGSEVFLYMDGEDAVIRADIIVDTAQELPGVDDFLCKKLAMGSIAWDISTGDFYGLSSSGTWIKQGEE